MKQISVLIIEDDDADRKLIMRLLARSEYRTAVTEKVCVEEALNLDLPDLHAIFLDHQLPGANGLECLSEFRSLWPKAAIFFMTGQGDEDIAKTAIKYGATDYAPKHTLNQNAIDRMLKNGLAQALAQWRLDEQRRDLATFTEVLVHDFRAPIRAAAYLAEQIEEDIDSGDMDEAREGLILLRKSATQMQDMLTSLADHVKLDRDDSMFETSPNDLIDRALTALQREISESEAEIVIEEHSLDLPLLCRTPQIAQVIQNLVANAIKYRGEMKPMIRISVASTQQDSLRFTVADKGIGVPEDQRERIFEPFKRVSAHNGISGTGLGLATCRKIINRHDGKIWCEAGEDASTSVHFEIPTGVRTVPDLPRQAVAEHARSHSSLA